MWHPCVASLHLERVVLPDQKLGVPVLGTHVQTEMATTW